MASSPPVADSFLEYIVVLLVILLATIVLMTQAGSAIRERLLTVPHFLSPRSSPNDKLQASPASIGGGSNKTVLVVDDDPITRFKLSSLLRKKGFVVEEVGDGEEAIQLYDNGRRYCLVVMDYEMPNMNGVETTMEIRKRDQRTIVVGSTIHDATQKQNEFLRAGANFVSQTKPITSDEIDDLVSDYSLL